LPVACNTPEELSFTCTKLFNLSDPSGTQMSDVLSLNDFAAVVIAVATGIVAIVGAVFLGSFQASG
jgi:hypothetical protein